MPNAIGTNEIGPSFGEELQAANIQNMAVFSWDTAGNFLFAPGTTPEQEADVYAVFTAHNPDTSKLLAHSETQRYKTQCLGIDYNGLPLQSDPVSSNTLGAMAGLANGDPNYTTEYKFADGTFATVTAADAIAMNQEVHDYVQLCFVTESDLSGSIMAGTVTTPQQIDAAYAAIASPPMRKRRAR